METVGRLRLQGLAVLAVALVVGGVVGVTLERARQATRPAVESRQGRRGPDDGRRRPEFDRQQGLPGFFRELNLTDEQREQIRAVFERQRPHTDSVMRAAFDEIESIRASVRAEIDAILTEEQREILEERIGERLPFGGRFDPERRRRRPGRDQR